MLTLPAAMVSVLLPFATVFTNPTWQKAQLLLVGTILTTEQRTVAAALRVMRRSDQDDYARCHEVLNRAAWSSREAARIPLLLLLRHLDHGDGPLVFGIRAADQSGNSGTPSGCQDQSPRYLPGRGVNADENMTQVRRSGIDPPPSITHTIAGWKLTRRRDRVAF